jgi:hypothetical protein
MGSDKEITPNMSVRNVRLPKFRMIIPPSQTFKKRPPSLDGTAGIE